MNYGQKSYSFGPYNLGDQSMWQATIQQIDKTSEGKIQVGVVLVSGGNKIQKTYTATGKIDNNWLKQQILNSIDELDSIIPYGETLTLGAFDLTLSQNPTEVARQQFYTNYSQWRSYKAASEAGLLDPNSKIVTDLYDILVATYKPEYRIF